MRENSVIHQALLRLPFAHLYPGIIANEWQPADAMLAQVNASVQHRDTAASTAQSLDPAHFAFRGTPTDGAKHAARELRRLGRNRQRRS